MDDNDNEEPKVGNAEIPNFDAQYDQVARKLKKQKKAVIEEEKEEEENEKRIAIFREIDATAMDFFKINLKTRHVFSTPICYPSIFNPRYKKLMLLVTELSVECLVISLMMTDSIDPLANSTTTATEIYNIPGLVGFAILAVLCGNAICYSMAWMFRLSLAQRSKMQTVVKSGLELQILKDW